MTDRSAPLAIGTETQWGRIVAVGITGGERYYWMVDKHRCVAMMPAVVVEPVAVAAVFPAAADRQDDLAAREDFDD